MLSITTVPMKGRTIGSDWQESYDRLITPDGNIYPVGTRFKSFETRNAGWLVLHSTARTIEGAIPFRRFFRY